MMMQATAVEPEGGEGSKPVDDRAVTSRFPTQRRIRPRTIVVVDDSEDAQEWFRLNLETAGYHVLSARNGKDALELLVDHSTPSAIIVDLFMPVMDGFELMDVLRSYTRLARVPLVVVSASDGQIAFPGGDARFLKKPIRELELLRTIDEVISGVSPTSN